MVKAILFDLFETLVTESHTRPASVASHAPTLGCDREAFRSQWKALRPDVMIGRMSFVDALREITTKLGRPADEQTLCDLSDERARIKAEAFARIEPDVLTMLDRLRAANVRLGVVSNCCAEDVAGWPRCALASRFDCTAFSCVIGIAKPDPEIYRTTLRRLGMDASDESDVSDVSDAWFIGDGQDDELRGAEQAGLRAWKALWFLKRWPHFKEEAPSTRNLNDVDEIADLLAGRHADAP